MTATIAIAEGPIPRAARRQAAVVEFWREAGLACWFDKDPVFDTTFRRRFLRLHYAAARRELDAWAETPMGALALLILLDQFPRNAFRGTAHMFATDALALALAKRFLAARFEAGFPPELQLFFFLPFTHSERLEDQEVSVARRSALGPHLERKAREHREIIRRFGRFPHRNAMLGRETTPEEAAYLAGGGFAG
jgi:uncharacterized protein (DUF924 family)